MDRKNFAKLATGSLLGAALVCGSALMTANNASASTWHANSPESIHIVKGQKVYTVKYGDTLWAISVKTNIKIATLAKASGITNPDFIQVGQKIILSGNNLTVEDSNGNIVGQAKLTNSDKVVKGQSFGTPVTAQAAASQTVSVTVPNTSSSAATVVPSKPATSDQGTTTPTNPDQGTTTPTNPDQGSTTTPTNPDQGSTTTPTNPDQGSTTTPTNPDQGSTTTPTNPDQGSTTTPTNPDQGTTTTPTNPDQGSTTTPTNPGQGSTTTPTNPDQGTTTPTNPDQGSTTTPTNPDQGSTTTPTNPDQGSTTTPTNPDQGSTTTPTNPDQGTTTPTNPDQGSTTTPTNPDQGSTTTPTNPDQGSTTTPTNPDQGSTTTPTNPDQGSTTTPTNPDQGSTTTPTNPDQGSTTTPSKPDSSYLTDPTNPNSFMTDEGISKAQSIAEDQINEIRAQAGVDPVDFSNKTLQAAADKRAAQCAAYFEAHDDYDKHAGVENVMADTKEQFKKQNIDFYYTGECESMAIIKYSENTPEIVGKDSIVLLTKDKDDKNMPVTHYAILTDKDSSNAAVGIAKATTKTYGDIYVVVVDFGSLYNIDDGGITFED
ncbi:LysM peptidoglycan-binding domain-containing protein [Limosilactobacillus allomucosae]|uniref:LysM peptidoglycan-binding domain-containing protein n=1 Tax=Limosilactobacillus allomucosae TaxID=3142938 RepID=UPI003264B648